MRDRSGWRPRLVAAALATAPVLLILGPAATPAAAATSLKVTGAYDGSYVPGRPMAVRVEVAADRLVRGRLEVTAGSATTIGIPVEVPGGSTKEFLVVLPPWHSFQFDGAVGVAAVLRDGSNEVATGNGVLQSSTGQELVGLLPGALGGRPVPGAAPLAVDAGTARFTAVGPAELAQAPASLGPLSTIGAAGDELARLPAPARSAILTWLEQGGHLLVDADPGQTVEGLPPPWQPGRDGRAPAGRGEVRLTGDAIAGGRWPGLVEPTGWAVTGDPSMRSDGLVGQALASEAGLRVPRLGWLVAFLALYVLVAGPVVFLVVRRRGHPELAWVAVPLVAVMFTAGSYVGGRGLRHTTRQVDTSIVATGLGGPTASTWTGVFSASGQTSRIRMGPGWMPGGDSDADVPSSLRSVTVTPEGAEGSLPLDSGQFAVMSGVGPIAAEGALEVSAVSRVAGEATGRVKNTTAWALDDVAVFVGTGGTLVGALAPGEEREWKMTETDQNFLFQGEAGIEFRVWGSFDAFVPDQKRMVDLSLWQMAEAAGGQEFRGPGEVVAAGWTRSFAPPVEVDGRDAGGGGRALVLGRNRVDVPADGASIDVRREVVRAPDFRGGLQESFVVRFVTADADRGGRTPDASRLTLRAPSNQMEVWQDGAWRPLPGIGNAGAAANGGSLEFRLPAEAVRGDVVYLRFPAFSSIVDVNGLFTLREQS